MGKKVNEFVVSAADVAFYHNDVLAFTGIANLNTSLNVSMESQEVTAGKGNKTLFVYKYGRKLAVDLEAANWDLRYIAANVGSEIFTGLDTMFKLNDCVTLTAGKGVLEEEPIGDVAVELPNGEYVVVSPSGSTVDLSTYGLDGEAVKCTYKYETLTNTITIDAETSPLTGRLVLDADKHDSKKGKTGTVQIEIPSYSLDGNFDISFTPDGVASTKLAGNALAVEGDSCADGKSVYAYIKETVSEDSQVAVADISVMPSTVSLAVNDKVDLRVIGLRSGQYSNVQIDNADCTFKTDDASIASASNSGVITAKAAGQAIITVSYGNAKDVVVVQVA